MIRKLFNWIFKAELDKLNSEILKAKNIADKLEQLVKHGSAIIDNSDFGYLYKILPYNMIKRFACATSILKNEEEKGWIAIPEYSRCKFCPINHICPSAIKQEKC